MTSEKLTDEEREDAFWRRLTLPEEDRIANGNPYRGGVGRWFRSPNIVPIERYRRRKRRNQSRSV